MIFDLATRVALLAGVVFYAARSIWMMKPERTQNSQRRFALTAPLWSTPFWIWFEVNLIINGAVADAELVWAVWQSRVALAMTLVGWHIVQGTIRDAEDADQTSSRELPIVIMDRRRGERRTSYTIAVSPERRQLSSDRRQLT